MQSTVCYINYLPVEILVYIFSFLTGDKLTHAKLYSVCRRWREVVWDFTKIESCILYRVFCARSKVWIFHIVPFALYKARYFPGSRGVPYFRLQIDIIFRGQPRFFNLFPDIERYDDLISFDEEFFYVFVYSGVKTHYYIRPFLESKYLIR